MPSSPATPLLFSPFYCKNHTIYYQIWLPDKTWFFQFFIKQFIECSLTLTQCPCEATPACLRPGQLYLLILVSCHCGEFSFFKGERFNPFSWQGLNPGQVNSAVLLHHMHAGLVLMHGLQNYLGEKWSNATRKIGFPSQHSCHLRMTPSVVTHKERGKVKLGDSGNHTGRLVMPFGPLQITSCLKGFQSKAPHRHQTTVIPFPDWGPFLFSNVADCVW